ncbi:MAG TPA: hypothetical protein DCR77_11345 [Flavobacteriaceae bacterium]|nr:hypothetical protein [Flavobacteriaceae bacterium]
MDIFFAIFNQKYGIDFLNKIQCCFQKTKLTRSCELACTIIYFELIKRKGISLKKNKDVIKAQEHFDFAQCKDFQFSTSEILSKIKSLYYN